MAVNPINTTRKRSALKSRKEPYWFNFKRGAAVGLYVGESKSEWCARARDPIGGAKYKYATFGEGNELSYEDAEAKARAFADRVAQVERPDYTVRDACADYVQDARVRNSESSAKGIEQRLAHSVPSTLASKRLTDLRTIDLNRWRDGLVRTSDDAEDVRRSKDGANRLLAILKAALNLAFRSGLAASDAEWRRVQAFRDVDAARTLFLDPEQVKALLAAADGCFRNLLHAAVLTGARYGELADAVVKDFDAQGGTLHLDGKTGPRTCYLSGDGIAFFKRVAKGKLPGAPLLPRDDGAHLGHVPSEATDGCGSAGCQTARRDRFLFPPALPRQPRIVGWCARPGYCRELRDQHPHDRKALREVHQGRAAHHARSGGAVAVDPRLPSLG
ncbi:hypothetical protein CCR95_21950 [Thiocystis minor]|uniref:hypothetical protein n=1 Tax=Thiocystis minor TaxID=61597 RepID=UPI00191459B0|nr:hypothetical protein [Thiocystis minor]MBK5966665.1 hypothetical protein [Thiocystis minor]